LNNNESKKNVADPETYKEKKTRSQSYTKLSFVKRTFLSFFAFKLGCFKVHALFSLVANTQA
jgi:hypothetical protein